MGYFSHMSSHWRLSEIALRLLLEVGGSYRGFSPGNKACIHHISETGEAKQMYKQGLPSGRLLTH